jgi:D-glycero-beta-D-manno-heptose-7-phosphate kinase
VIDRITRHCQELGIITLVDPKKHNFLAYRNVTIFKPNLKEVREGLSIALETINEKELNNVHHLLQEQLHHSATFITLSEKGVFAADGKKSYHESAHIRDIADVSGAGDTVIATAALVYALSRDLQLMASVANIAGGLVCEEIGVMPIDRNRLETECIKLLSTNKEQDGN